MLSHYWPISFISILFLSSSLRQNWTAVPSHPWFRQEKKWLRHAIGVRTSVTCMCYGSVALEAAWDNKTEGKPSSGSGPWMHPVCCCLPWFWFFLIPPCQGCIHDSRQHLNYAADAPRDRLSVDVDKVIVCITLSLTQGWGFGVRFWRGQ